MIASYPFPASLRKRARRVAGPITSGSTPLARGSSVPVWPMRRSPSTRRSRATTSCEVGPAGVSMTSRPSIDRVLDFLGEQFLERVDGARERAAGGALVTAGMEPPSDGADAGVAF